MPIFEIAVGSLIVPILISMIRESARVWVGTFFLLLSGGEFADPRVSVILRLLALFSFALTLVFASDPRRVGGSGVAAARLVRVFAATIVGALTLVGVMHGEYSSLLNLYLGTLLLLAIASLATKVPQHSLASVFTSALVVFISLGLVLSYVSPDVAIENDRVRGLTGNANLFAFYCLLLAGVSLLSSRKSFRSLVCVTLGAAGIFLSGSRTSALALVALLALSFLVGRPTARRFVGAGILMFLLSSLFLQGIPKIEGMEIWGRSYESRDGALHAVREVADIAPWTGVGFGNMPTNVASSPAATFVLGGWLACIALGVGVLFLLRVAGSISAGHVVLVVCALIHSLGEAWMISTSGPMVATFCLALIALPLMESRRLGEGAPSRRAVGRLVHANENFGSAAGIGDNQSV